MFGCEHFKSECMCFICCLKYLGITKRHVEFQGFFVQAVSTINDCLPIPAVWYSYPLFLVSLYLFDESSCTFTQVKIILGKFWTNQGRWNWSLECHESPTALRIPVKPVCSLHLVETSGSTGAHHCTYRKDLLYLWFRHKHHALAL